MRSSRAARLLNKFRFGPSGSGLPSSQGAAERPFPVPRRAGGKFDGNRWEFDASLAKVGERQGGDGAIVQAFIIAAGNFWLPVGDFPSSSPIRLGQLRLRCAEFKKTNENTWYNGLNVMFYGGHGKGVSAPMRRESFLSS